MVTCHRCGGLMSEEKATDHPFRLDVPKILVIRDTPAQICGQCGEILLSNAVMGRVDEVIDKIRDRETELEVVRYAA